MACEIKFRVCDVDIDVAVKARAGVPSGVFRLPRVSADCNHVLLAVFQFVGDVAFKPEITVVGATDFFTVEPYVAHKKYPLEVEEHTFTFPVGWRCQGLAIPSFAHFLECACAEAAFDVGHRIVNIRFFVGRGFHPFLVDLEIMGHVYDLPSCVVGLGEV